MKEESIFWPKIIGIILLVIGLILLTMEFLEYLKNSFEIIRQLRDKTAKDINFNMFKIIMSGILISLGTITLNIPFKKIGVKNKNESTN